jgi:hypothetical protein
MDKTKVAKQLLKLAKSLLSENKTAWNPRFQPNKVALKAKWMSNFDKLVHKDAPDLDQKIMFDYWDTATFFFNQGKKPEEAAKRMLEIWNERKKQID